MRVRFLFPVIFPLLFLGACSGTSTSGPELNCPDPDNPDCEDASPSKTDTIAPTVTPVNPGNNSTNVSISNLVVASFSEPMNPSTINADTFSLKANGTVSVGGGINYTGTTVTFDPSGDFAHDTNYTVTVTTGARDLAGNTLEADTVWTFKTVTAPGDDDDDDDAVPPRATPISPMGADTPVTSLVIVSFSEPMDPDTINSDTFTLQVGSVIPGIGGYPSVTGSVGYEGTTAIFEPSDDLSPSTTYTATVTTGAKDLAGNALEADTAWTFKTGTAPPGGGDVVGDDDDEPDGPPLTVVSTEPGNGATGLPITAVIGINFSERPEPATINSENVFFFSEDGTEVEWVGGPRGLSSYDIMPLSNLRYNKLYTIILSRNVTDIARNPLNRPYMVSFRTRPAPPVVDISGGALHTVATMSDGTVRTCGYSAAGRLGYPSSESNNPAAGEVGGLSNAVKVCAGSNHTVALIETTGMLWVWGDNSRCQLGREDREARENPVSINSSFMPAPVSLITDIACGGDHTLILDSMGRVFALGRGDYGQLGNGEFEDICSPVRVAIPRSVRIEAISAGVSHSVALDEDGYIWTWGRNESYQLGIPNGRNTASPVRLEDIDHIHQIAAGHSHTIVSGRFGLFGWGDNQYGQIDHDILGPPHYREPVAIEHPETSPVLTVVGVAAGEIHSIILSSEGEVWAWGDNTYRQLSRELFLRINPGPFQVNLPSPAVAISAGQSHNSVLLEDGGVVSWGRNNFGQLCRETTSLPSSTPTLINWFE